MMPYKPLRGKYPPQSACIAVAVIWHALAISTTVFRLIHRWSSRRLWWDDFWVAVALTTDTTIFIFYLVGLSIDTTKILGVRWSLSLCYTAVMWSSKLSVAVTIKRLSPQRGIFYRLTRLAPMLFGIIWMAITIQDIVGCTRKGASGFPWCTVVRKYTLYTGAQELVTNLVGDLWLLVAPVYMLRQMKLERRQRRLILTIFLCGIFTALSSICHGIVTMLNFRSWMILTAHLELALSTCIPNLLAAVTYIYRIFCKISADQNVNEDRRAVPELNIQNSSAVVGYEDTTSEGIPRHNTITNPTSSSPDSVELTVLSDIGSTGTLSTIPNTPSTHDSNILNSVPFSSFSFPSSKL